MSEEWGRSRGGGFGRIATMTSRARLVHHRVSPADWTGPDLRIAVLSDLHVIAPWTSLGRVAAAVAQINAMAPDLVVLGGDYLVDPHMPGRVPPIAALVDVLAPLKARHGTFAILGNHDWHDCPLAQATALERSSVAEAFAAGGMRLLRNESVSINAESGVFHVVGFDSQRPTRKDWTRGLHRPDAAFADVPHGAATILLAHEPDYFALGDGRAQLQISGHTHGGQVNLLGWRPVVPSQYGARYAWGHHVEADRHLVVSGGFGFSGIPFRLAQPPEITMIELVAQRRKGGA